MKKNTGKKFEQKFKSWHKEVPGCLCLRLPDYASTGSFEKAIADYMVLYSGKTTFYELKHTEDKVSFAFNLIAEHQLGTGLRVQETGNNFNFVIEDGKHNVYIVPVFVIREFMLKESLKAKPKKSVKFWMLEDYKITKKDYLARFL